MAETTCRMLFLSFPVVLLLLFNVGSVAGDGFLDEINSESVSSLFSSGSLDDAKKAISAASPDVQNAVDQLAATASEKGDDAKEAFNSWAQSPDAAASPELAQAYKDAEEEKDGSSWKDWFKGKMSGMGYGSPAGSPEAAAGPAMGPSSSSSDSDSPADIQVSPAAAPSA